MVTAWHLVMNGCVFVPVARASADITVNTTSGELCFFSLSQKCNLI